MLTKSISTIEEIKKYVSINVTSSFIKIDPHFSRAERKHLVPLVGAVLFNSQVTAYNSALKKVDDMPVVQQGLHLLLQEALSNIGSLNYLAQAQLQMSDNGIRISVNNEMKTAFQWQIEDLKFQLGKDGFDVLEEILLYLEGNTATFPTWKTSDAYYEQKSYFVNTAAEFNKHFHINGSRLTYLMLRYLIGRIEEQDLKPLLGSDFYAELKTAIRNDALTSDQKNLVNNYLAPGVTLLTIAKAITERAVEVTEFGVSVNLYGYYGNMKQKDPAKPADRMPMIEQLLKDGSKFLKDGIELVQANPLLFPSYVAATILKSNFTTINTEASGFFKT